MAPHPHVDAPLTDYILIEGRSFRKKIRLIIVKLLKKNSSQSTEFGYYFYVYQEKVATYSSITSFSRFLASSVAKSSYFFVRS